MDIGNIINLNTEYSSISDGGADVSQTDNKSPNETMVGPNEPQI